MSDEQSVPPSNDKSPSSLAEAPSSIADQSMQTQPLLGQQQQQPVSYPVQTGGVNYEVEGQTNVPLGPTAVVESPEVMIQQPLAHAAAAPAGSPRVSYVKHLALSSFVVVCCCPLCGLIAFSLAMLAHFSAESPYKNAAKSSRRYSKASIVFSVIGIVLGIISIIAIVVGLIMAKKEWESCKYVISTKCYKYRRNRHQSGITGCDGDYSDDYCYYN